VNNPRKAGSVSVFQAAVVEQQLSGMIDKMLLN
jgi:hypothetical protein